MRELAKNCGLLKGADIYPVHFFNQDDEREGVLVKINCTIDLLTEDSPSRLDLISVLWIPLGPGRFPVIDPGWFFGFRFRVCMPSFFMLNGLFTYKQINYVRELYLFSPSDFWHKKVMKWQFNEPKFRSFKIDRDSHMIVHK